MKAFGYILILFIILMTVIFAVPLYASGKVMGTIILVGIALTLCFGVCLAYGPWHARYLQMSVSVAYWFFLALILLTSLFFIYRAVETVFTQHCKWLEETGQGALYGKLINASCTYFGIYAYAASHLLLGLFGLWLMWGVKKYPDHIKYTLRTSRRTWPEQ
ncbi:hypothetical protein CO614_05975 [Lysobacteraceae bacterium NML120232]|nr:hypothetical protein CO614_05975 [Xanthomonadaceae bacterium NML120232]